VTFRPPGQAGQSSPGTGTGAKLVSGGWNDTVPAPLPPEANPYNIAYSYVSCHRHLPRPSNIGRSLLLLHIRLVDVSCYYTTY
jgi:hypothetical protein